MIAEIDFKVFDELYDLNAWYRSNRFEIISIETVNGSIKVWYLDSSPV